MMKNSKLQTPNSKTKGFTLVELLISMAIATVVGMAGYVIFSSSNWSYKVQEDVSEAQQNVRVATDRLAKDIRMAGFGLPDPPFSITIGTSGALTAPIMFTNNSTDSDVITILGIGYEVGTLDTTTAVVNCGNGIRANNSGANCIRLSTPASDSIDKFFNDAGTFQTTRINISLGGAQYIVLATAGHSQGTRTLQLGLPATLDRDYPDGTSVFIIQAVKYTIETNDATATPPCISANPCLRSEDFTGLRGSGSQTFAENIEDIQFAYGVDGTISPTFEKDGKIDYSGTYDSAAFQNAPTDPSSIIAVRANIVGKTRNKDSRGATFKIQCLEDRSTDTTTCGTAVAPATDGYRRRALTKIIKIRNTRQGT